MNIDDNVQRLEEIPDMARFLAHASGYGPGEILDSDGESEYFEGDDACMLIAKAPMCFAVMCQHDFELPQIIVFYLDDDDPSRIESARRVDGTENNMNVIIAHVEGRDTTGMELDEFPWGYTRKDFDRDLGL